MPPKKSWNGSLGIRRWRTNFDVLMLTTPAFVCFAMSRNVSRPKGPALARGACASTVGAAAWAVCGRRTWVV